MSAVFGEGVRVDQAEYAGTTRNYGDAIGKIKDVVNWNCASFLEETPQMPNLTRCQYQRLAHLER